MAIGATQAGIPSAPDDGGSEVGAAAVLVSGASLALGDPEGTLPRSSRSRSSRFRSAFRSCLSRAFVWSPGASPGSLAAWSRSLSLASSLAWSLALSPGLAPGLAPVALLGDGVAEPPAVPDGLVGAEPDALWPPPPDEPDEPPPGWGEGCFVGFGVGEGDGLACLAGATPGADLEELPFQEKATDPPSGTLSESTPWLAYVQLPDFPSDHHRPQ
jgi:hypothetical protein